MNAFPPADADSGIFGAAKAGISNFTQWLGCAHGARILGGDSRERRRARFFPDHQNASC